jgi:hypothetical protein
MFLPFIPYKSFAIKGYLLGAIWAVVSSFIPDFSIVKIILLLLILPPISAFLSLNFTGASTYTSITGVRLEVKIATPIFIVSISLGAILKILNVINIL